MRQRQRRGFTLPELLVAAALAVLIMAIIAEAFKQTMDSFRHLKSTADLQQRLRTAAIVLRRDLLAFHFETGRKLTDLPPGPNEGYFRVEATSPYDGHPATSGGGLEGVDGDGFPSVRASAHRLSFTVQYTGSRPEDYFSAPVGSALSGYGPPALAKAGHMYTQWAEVGYFLTPLANNTGPILANGQQLYALHRSVRLMESSASTRADTTANQGQYQNVSWYVDPLNTAQIKFNDPLSVQANRSQTLFTPKSGAEEGDDLVLSDVLSFQVQLMFDETLNNPGSVPKFTDLTPNVASGNAPTLGGVYDTALIPPDRITDPTRWTYANVRAIKITLRVWDPKVEQVRQVSIIQDL